MRFSWLICLMVLCGSTEAIGRQRGKLGSPSLTKMGIDVASLASSVISPNQQEASEWIQQFPEYKYALHAGPSGRFWLDDAHDFVKDELRKGLSWEAGHAALIRQYVVPGTVVLDIGAHIGVHTLTMSEAVGPNGMVIAFEPQPKIFRELVVNMATNHRTNIQFYWGAVGHSYGFVELSPLVQFNEGATGISGGSGILAHLVDIDSMDLPRVSLIKIDVESSEDDVLIGAKSTILRDHPVILIEIRGGYICFETAPPDVKEQILHTKGMLEQMGYRVEHLAIHDYIAFPKGPNLLPEN